MFGPLGRATFYPNLGKNVLCIAGGSGIAGHDVDPLRARGRSAISISSTATCSSACARIGDGFYLDELVGSSRASSRTDCSVTIALSDEAVPATARSAHPALDFEQGLVHEVAGKAMQGKYQNVRAYLAGPPPAVDASIRMLLLQAKLPADHIRYDKFS